MTNRYDPLPAAAALAAAWHDGRQLKELPADIRPATLDQGYEVQDAFARAVNDRVAGWKLGVGSPAAMRAAGLDRPLVGRLFAAQCHRADATIRLRGSAPVTVEFEIAFVLGRDIAPGTAPGDPLDAVASTHAAFELVLSRFVDRRAVGWPSFAGDNVGFEASILGAEIAPASIGQAITSVTVDAGGKTMARAMAGDDLSEPVAALAYLFAHARDRGITLRRGEIVTAGAVAKPFDIAGGPADITARFLDTSLRVNLLANSAANPAAHTG